jgi:hypothetical protein
MNIPAIESCISSSAPHKESADKHNEMRQGWNPIIAIAIAIAMLTLSSMATAIRTVARFGIRLRSRTFWT